MLYRSPVRKNFQVIRSSERGSKSSLRYNSRLQDSNDFSVSNRTWSRILVDIEILLDKPRKYRTNEAEPPNYFFFHLCTFCKEFVRKYPMILAKRIKSIQLIIIDAIKIKIPLMYIELFEIVRFRNGSYDCDWSSCQLTIHIDRYDIHLSFVDKTSGKSLSVNSWID